MIITPKQQDAELSDVELLLRAVSYSRPWGFEVVAKWREISVVFGISETAARSLCKRFGVNPDEKVAR
jgi:hypothetical protein